MPTNPTRLWRLTPVPTASSPAAQAPPEPPGTFGQLVVTAVWVSSLTRLNVILDNNAALACDPGGYWDALNPDNWALTRIDTAPAPKVVRVERVAGDWFLLHLVSPLLPGTQYDLACQNVLSA